MTKPPPATAADAIRRNFSDTYRERVMALRNRWLRAGPLSPALSEVDVHRFHCYVRDFDKVLAGAEAHVRLSLFYALHVICAQMQLGSCYSFVQIPKHPPRIVARLHDAPDLMTQSP